MPTLSEAYFILVFLSATGVLQASAARAGLRGMMFFRNSIQCYIFAAVAIVGSFFWFYALVNRNTRPALEGSQQFLWFVSASFLALILTLGLSSALNNSRLDRKSKNSEEGVEGLEALESSTYLGALRHFFKRLGSKASR